MPTCEMSSVFLQLSSQDLYIPRQHAREIPSKEISGIGSAFSQRNRVAILQISQNAIRANDDFFARIYVATNLLVGIVGYPGFYRNTHGPAVPVDKHEILGTTA